MKPDIFAGAQALVRRVRDALLEEPAGPDAARRRRRRVVIVFVGGVFIACVAVWALTHLGDRPPPALTAEERAQAVSVAPLASMEFNPRVALEGEARPRRDFRVYAPSSGVRVLQLLADEGDYVRAGQALARLDTALSNAQTRQAEANVASALAAQKRAADEYARAESIRDSGALSTEAIEQRRAAAAAADAQLAAARAQLAEINARLQGGFVRAPAAGLVIQRTAEIGRPVDNQMLFRIAGDNALEVAAQVAEADVLALRPGAHATFRLIDGTTVDAVLRRGPASIDSATRTGEALFDLPRGTAVRAGMYLRGEARLAPRIAPAVNQSSLLYADGAPYVFVLGDDNRVRRTPVRIGMRADENVEIVSGLDAGARVVGAGASFLQDGDLVRPIAAPQAQEAAPDLRGRDG
ncbi:MAG: efflux RND transporter periplasmic adaptor subunit [Hyphomonadaceae bacterium]